MTKRRRFQTRTNQTVRPAQRQELPEPTVHQHFSFKRRTVLGIPVHHTFMDTDYSGKGYITRIQTHDPEFVVNHLADIFKSAFGSNTSYEYTFIHFDTRLLKFCTAKVHTPKNEIYVLEGYFDENGISLHYHRHYPEDFGKW
jgi:hypothetical protein